MTTTNEELCYVKQMTDFLYENQYTISTAIATVFGLALYRYWIGGGWCYSKADLQGKTVIITGANAGIGKETARDLTRRGARVIMACRNLEAASSAAADIQRENLRGTVCIKELDLSSFKSIRKFADEILKTEKRIDILINNAGLTCSKQKTEDGYDMVFGTNHLGPFLLTNLLLERLKESAPSRIVNVSSGGHKMGEIHWEDLNLGQPNNYGVFNAYYQSKLANNLFTLELADKLKGTGVTTYAVCPGFVKTQIMRHTSLWLGLPIVVASLLFGKNSVQGAQTTIYCAVDENMKNQSGKYYKDCREKTPSNKSMDKKSAVRLWTESMKMVGLKEIG